MHALAPLDLVGHLARVLAASRVRTTRAGTPTATLPSGRSPVTTAPAPTTTLSAQAHAVEDLRPRSEPHVVAQRDAARGARLLEHRRGRVARTRGRRRPGRCRRRRGRPCPTSTREPEKISEWKPMFTRSPRTMSPFLHERIVPRPRKTPSPSVMPSVRRALRVEHHQVVDHHAVAEPDLVRMPQHHAVTEDDAATHRAEEKRVEELPQQPGPGRRAPRTRRGPRARRARGAPRLRLPTTRSWYFRRADLPSPETASWMPDGQGRGVRERAATGFDPVTEETVA